MPSSRSDSRSQSSTTTINEDARVAGGETGSITLGKSASLQFSTEFGPEVAGAFNELIDLARDAGSAVMEVSTKAIEAAEDALNKSVSNQTQSLNTVASTVERTEKGAATVFQDLFPMFIAGIIGIGAILVFKK